MPGFIIYQGPSLIDQKPIVVIYLTGSDNVKTGNMAQTYILRADIDPISASRHGDDYSICGDCKHRGTPNPAKSKGWADNRACYVNLIHGPNQVYKAFKAGKYTTVKAGEIQRLGKNQNIRLGTYGDPLAVPSGVWSNLISESFTWTGYTHQSNNNPLHGAINLCMVSVDSKDEYQQAQSKGLRTFRIIPYSEYKEFGHNSLMQNEILCPASKEASIEKSITCSDCKLCKGQTIKAKSIAIVAHGTGRKHIT